MARRESSGGDLLEQMYVVVALAVGEAREDGRRAAWNRLRNGGVPAPRVLRSALLAGNALRSRLHAALHAVDSLAAARV